MSTKQKLKFIVNPHSGVKKKKNLFSAIQKYLDTSKYDYEIVYTEFSGHATELAAKAVEEGFNTVVAVGGDGSVNEVASGLIGTNVNLGILPMGSGNGFAMHTGIGRNYVNAIKILNQGKVVRIDSCTMNGKPFVNLCGLGFDGLVANAFQRRTKRGFFPYLQLSLEKAFSAGFYDFKIKIDDHAPIEESAFLLEIANGPMFGYNFVIAPSADLVNGSLDILLIKKANKLLLSLLVPRLLLSNLDKGGRLVKTFKAKQIEVEFDAPMYMHYDGEGFIQQENKIRCEIVPKSLNVILPQNGRY